MARPQSAPVPTISRQEIREFHVTGRGLGENAAASIEPVALKEIALPALDSEYPLYTDGLQAPRPLSALLGEVLDGAGVAAAVSGFRKAIGERPFSGMQEVRSTVLEAMDAGTASKLGSVIPVEGWLVPFSAHTATILYACAIERSRKKARLRFQAQILHYRDQLQDLLTSSAPSISPEALVSSLAEGEFFQGDVLAKVLRRPMTGLRQMEGERRTRILEVLTVLERAVQQAECEPAFWIFDSSAESPDVEPLGGKTRRVDDSCSEALRFCEQQVSRFSELLRALQTARLEIAGVFHTEVHGTLLGRLDWQSADVEELRALPPVLIVERAPQLADQSLTQFCRLLRSGLPVHVLIEDPGPDAKNLGTPPADFGYLTISHREVHVVQSSLACPGHLAAGLAEMADVAAPAVTVAVVPRRFGNNVEAAWREAAVLQLSNAYPLYSYNPRAGEHWSETFRLSSSSRTGTAGELVTVAHAAAISPELSQCMRVLPGSAWNDEQVELAVYLSRYQTEPPLAIPYISVEVDGAAGRAVLTRELVNLCRDRRRAIRVFEELAGVGNAYVEAALAKTREEAQQSADEREKQARTQGATDAIYRVVTLLTNTRPSAPASAVPSASVTTPAAAIPPVAIPPASIETPRAAQEEDIAAYIESAMCTSCNDCMKVNARLFLYNAEKQAYLGDPANGTYAELVKAAEGCPAKCIHPGTPRPGDASATPAVRARAAKLTNR